MQSTGIFGDPTSELTYFGKTLREHSPQGPFNGTASNGIEMVIMDAHNEALIIRSFLDLTLQVSGLSAACAVRVSNGAQFCSTVAGL
ncbi:hypothetical protein CC1G_15385 [Coprinopsis cinerea okayama7|uniref:Uncharacterized protein n=1 Tax=Coprinopsis cinerea (strain Okayama-7 / 130 / ATCC MYA-4618 / FGSC 9003) TaxID=240176 RepID=D6RQR5_COPC7|nr:hypothetical protein CC1G_15385 [Coprinopsis cinerea okayama7\|eukprot:XP_002910107.1 hypothetical protein CC1G_15385 [Coprinopsis cinerea okayama7\